MKKLLLILGFVTPLAGFSQARLVINGTTPVTIVENGGTAATPIYIDLANPNGTAITTVGTNGWIISENEFNMVKWDISNTNNGPYVIPFGVTGTTYYLPLTLNFSAAGSAGGSLKLSTWHTNNDNMSRPSDVTNMAAALAPGAPSMADNSWNAVDRFWVIDPTSYGTPPTPGSFVFTYANAGLETEIGGSNTPGMEPNLIAQRFNPAAGKGWGDWDGIGGTDVAGVNTGTVNTGALISGNFFRSWTLSNGNDPLPITLTSFTGVCDNGAALIEWTSGTEINNDFYTIKKTNDNVHFITVATIPGAGNSSSPINYRYVDNSPLPGTSYYILTSTDYDGTPHNYPNGTFEFTGCEGAQPIAAVTIYNSGTYIDIQINTPNAGEYAISLVDILGQTLTRQEKTAVVGNNEFRLNQDLTPGVYFVNVKNNSDVNYTKKLIVGVK